VEGFVLKRSVDIALAGLLLVVSLPILAVAAIAIKLDSQGPVLFCQARMGLKFKRFKILKLRTMYAGNQGRAYTVCGDPRVTRTGRWLRWLKVDELPQLWNVIRGEMSMVGPRPVVPELALEFEWAYSRLLEVRPGLTDPATLKYCREEDFLVLIPDPIEYFKAVLTPDKLRISAAYLEHSNVWSDLGVLAATALALVLGNWWPRFMRRRSAGQVEAAERMFREPAQGAETQGPIQNI
jgi:lipopolysaccharide/colanic/teichoic acid biosynthesis glycosyltransferase